MTYLSMDGVDDTLYTPSLTVSHAVVDMVLEENKGTLINITGEVVQWIESTWSNEENTVDFYVDGVYQYNVFSYSIPLNERIIIETHIQDRLGAKLGRTNFLSRRTDSYSVAKGNIYDIKIYNGATLVAHYDMSTGTVQDQSGNGNHATLTGGSITATESIGSINKSISLESESITETLAEGIISISETVDLQGESITLSEVQGQLVISKSISSNGIILTESEGQINRIRGLTGESSILSESIGSLQVEEAGITILSGESTTDIDSSGHINRIRNIMGESQIDTISESVMINLLIELISTSDTTTSANGNLVDLANERVESVYLIGTLIYDIYLDGTVGLNIYLNGGDDELQDFEIYQGNHKNIWIENSNSNYTGGSAKWIAKKAGSEAVLITKDAIIEEGKIKISLTPTDTANLLGSYYHEAEFEDALNNVTTTLIGTMKVLKKEIVTV